MRAQVLLFLTLFVAACGSAGPGVGADGDGGTDPNQDPNTDPNAGTDGGNGGPVGTGLPCDVKAVLVKECVSCHGAPPSQGAPMSITSYADLTAPSKTHPGKTVAEVSVLRMKDTTSPMPPGQQASAADIATMSNWVSGGMPKGTCGSAADAGADASGPNPYNTPLVCTSGTYWKNGDQGSASMHPGVACNQCHKIGGKASGKTFDIGGTVYPSAHEPDDCNGRSGIQVVITDANNVDHTLTTNAAGNFYHQDFFGFQKFPTPYRAKVVANGKTRVMVAPQTDGNCNACHTTNGAQNAPGRIMAP